MPTKVTIFTGYSDEPSIVRDYLQLSRLFGDIRRIFMKRRIALRTRRWDPGAPEDMAQLVAESDYCVFLFHERVGEVAQEQFDDALRLFEESEGSRPRIFVWFRGADQESESLGLFKQRLSSELLHYLKNYVDVDTVCCQMLLELERDGVGVPYEVRGTKLVYDDGDERSVLMDFGGVAAYANNERIALLQAQIDEIEPRYRELQARAYEDELSGEEEHEYEQLGTRHDDLSKQLRRRQREFLEQMRSFAEKMAAQDTSPRRLEALRLWYAGKPMEASQLMDADELEREADWHGAASAAYQKAADAERSKCASAIEDLHLLAQFLEGMVGKPVELRLAETYGRIIRLEHQFGFEPRGMWKYGRALVWQGVYTKAIDYLEDACEWYREQVRCGAEDKREAYLEILALLQEACEKSTPPHRYEAAMWAEERCDALRDGLDPEEGDEGIRRIAAELLSASKLLNGVGRADDARSFAEDAVGLLEGAYAASPCDEVAAELSMALGWQGSLLAEKDDDSQAAEEAFARQLGVLEEALARNASVDNASALFEARLSSARRVGRRGDRADASLMVADAVARIEALRDEVGGVDLILACYLAHDEAERDLAELGDAEGASSQRVAAISTLVESYRDEPHPELLRQLRTSLTRASMDVVQASKDVWRVSGGARALQGECLQESGEVVARAEALARSLEGVLEEAVAALAGDVAEELDPLAVSATLAVATCGCANAKALANGAQMVDAWLSDQTAAMGATERLDGEAVRALMLAAVYDGAAQYYYSRLPGRAEALYCEEEEALRSATRKGWGDRSAKVDDDLRAGVLDRLARAQRAHSALCDNRRRPEVSQALKAEHVGTLSNLVRLRGRYGDIEELVDALLEQARQARRDGALDAAASFEDQALSHAREFDRREATVWSARQCLYVLREVSNDRWAAGDLESARDLVRESGMVSARYIESDVEDELSWATHGLWVVSHKLRQLGTGEDVEELLELWRKAGRRMLSLDPEWYRRYLNDNIIGMVRKSFDGEGRAWAISTVVDLASDFYDDDEDKGADLLRSISSVIELGITNAIDVGLGQLGSDVDAYEPALGLAHALCVRCADLHRAYLAAHPNADSAVLFGSQMTRLAHDLRVLDCVDEAGEFYDESVRELDKYVREDPSTRVSLSLATLLVKEAERLEDLGKDHRDEALSLRARSLFVGEAYAGAYPSERRMLWLSSSYAAQSAFCYRSGDSEGRDAAVDRMLELLDQSWSRPHTPLVTRTYLRQLSTESFRCGKAGRTERSLSMARRGCEVARSEYERHRSVQTAGWYYRALSNAATSNGKARRLDERNRLFAEELEVLDWLFAEHPTIASAKSLAYLHGFFEEAERRAQKAARDAGDHAASMAHRNQRYFHQSERRKALRFAAERDFSEARAYADVLRGQVSIAPEGDGLGIWKPSKYMPAATGVGLAREWVEVERRVFGATGTDEARQSLADALGVLCGYLKSLRDWDGAVRTADELLGLLRVAYSESGEERDAFRLTYFLKQTSVALAEANRDAERMALLRERAELLGTLASQEITPVRAGKYARAVEDVAAVLSQSAGSLLVDEDAIKESIVLTGREARVYRMAIEAKGASEREVRSLVGSLEACYRRLDQRQAALGLSAARQSSAADALRCARDVRRRTACQDTASFLASALEHSAQMHLEAGDAERAEREMAEAMGVVSEEFESRRPGWAAALLSHLATMRSRCLDRIDGRTEEARSFRRQALDVCLGVARDEQRKAEELKSVLPALVEACREYVEAAPRDDHEACIGALREARGVRELCVRLAGVPGATVTPEVLAGSAENIGLALRRMGRLGSSEAAYGIAIEELRRAWSAESSGSMGLRLAAALHEESVRLRSAGHLEGAVQAEEERVQVMREVFGRRQSLEFFSAYQGALDSLRDLAESLCADDEAASLSWEGCDAALRLLEADPDAGLMPCLDELQREGRRFAKSGRACEEAACAALVCHHALSIGKGVATTSRVRSRVNVALQSLDRLGMYDDYDLAAQALVDQLLDEWESNPEESMASTIEQALSTWVGRLKRRSAWLQARDVQVRLVSFVRDAMEQGVDGFDDGKLSRSLVRAGELAGRGGMVREELDYLLESVEIDYEQDELDGRSASEVTSTLFTLDKVSFCLQKLGYEAGAAHVTRERGSYSAVLNAGVYDGPLNPGGFPSPPWRKSSDAQDAQFRLLRQTHLTYLSQILGEGNPNDWHAAPFAWLTGRRVRAQREGVSEGEHAASLSDLEMLLQLAARRLEEYALSKGDSDLLLESVVLRCERIWALGEQYRIADTQSAKDAYLAAFDETLDLLADEDHDERRFREVAGRLRRRRAAAARTVPHAPEPQRKAPRKPRRKPNRP